MYHKAKTRIRKSSPFGSDSHPAPVTCPTPAEYSQLLEALWDPIDKLYPSIRIDARKGHLPEEGTAEHMRLVRSVDKLRDVADSLSLDISDIIFPTGTATRTILERLAQDPEYFDEMHLFYDEDEADEPADFYEQLIMSNKSKISNRKPQRVCLHEDEECLDATTSFYARRSSSPDDYDWNAMVSQYGIKKYEVPSQDFNFYGEPVEDVEDPIPLCELRSVPNLDKICPNKVEKVAALCEVAATLVSAPELPLPPEIPVPKQTHSRENLPKLATWKFRIGACRPIVKYPIRTLARLYICMALITKFDMTIEQAWSHVKRMRMIAWPPSSSEALGKYVRQSGCAGGLPPDKVPYAFFAYTYARRMDAPSYQVYCYEV